MLLHFPWDPSEGARVVHDLQYDVHSGLAHSHILDNHYVGMVVF